MRQIPTLLVGAPRVASRRVVGPWADDMPVPHRSAPILDTEHGQASADANQLRELFTLVLPGSLVMTTQEHGTSESGHSECTPENQDE